MEKGQKIALALEIEPFFAEEAKKRQLATLRKGETPDVENVPQREQARSRDQAASAVGVSGKLVSAAQKKVEQSLCRRAMVSKRTGWTRECPARSNTAKSDEDRAMLATLSHARLLQASRVSLFDRAHKKGEHDER